MSVNSVTSGTAALQSLRSYFQDQKNDINVLQQSLSSGDLTGAQQAFDTLSKLAQNGSGGKNGQPFGGNTTLQKDFAAVGDALKSGDTTGAQKAFAQFTKDLQAARQAHKGNHQSPSTQGTAKTNSSSSQKVDSDGDYDNSKPGESRSAEAGGSGINLKA
jgi:hypothetical protein